MIATPQRSVTRFFIPLIDVLTLLFAIFLVMPLAKDAREAEARNEETVRADARKLAELEYELKKANERIGLMESQRSGQISKAAVRVLEVDQSDGALFYRDEKSNDGESRRRRYLRDRKAVEDLVRADQDRAGDATRLAYVINLPPLLDYAHPTRGDVDRFEALFRGLAPFSVDGDFAKGKESRP